MMMKNRLGSPDGLKEGSKQKSTFKFNRKQDNLKGERRKLEPFADRLERICFISPNKNQNISPRQQTDQMPTSNRSDKDQNLITAKEESIIIANDVQANDQRMNDSILSLMQQLNGVSDRRLQAEKDEYLVLIEQLQQEIDTLQTQNKQLREKVKDMEMVQQFLIQRETYISQVTDRNIALSEQLHQIQKDKESLSNQLRQLQADYRNQNQLYEDYITTLKNQRDIQKKDFDMILKLNMDLNQKLEQKSKKLKRVIRQSNGQLKNSPKKQRKSARKHKQCAISERSNMDASETVQTKQTDLSELNVKSMDQYSILQKLNDQFQKCQCKEIKKLRQKIRYNQIEIDILKRIKLGSEFTKAENEKLKNQVKKLRAKIEHFNNKKNNKKGQNSDSSLQLSLSPRKI